LKNISQYAEFALAERYQKADDIYACLNNEVNKKADTRIFKSQAEILAVLETLQNPQIPILPEHQNRIKKWIKEKFDIKHKKEKLVIGGVIVIALACLGITAFSLPKTAEAKVPIHKTPTAESTKKTSKTKLPSIETPTLLPTHEPTETATPAPHIILGVGGDMMLGRNVNIYARDHQNFNPLNGIIGDMGDINLINLESPLKTDCQRQSDPHIMVFCGDSAFIPALKQDRLVLGLANNHQNDFHALGETERLLTSAGIPFINSQNSENDFTEIEKNGIKLGFLSFDLVGPNIGINELGDNLNVREKAVLAKVKKYKGRTDWLIVQLHWGNEYMEKPDSWQVKFAHDLADSGVDILVGSHPHVVQTPLIENYGNKVIIYSLGNLVFDQFFSPKTTSFYWLDLELGKQKIIDIKKYPIRLDNHSGQPELVTP
jgi:poly-gamma-glutamate synthesis protein (capsule biosynthesis protein)